MYSGVPISNVRILTPPIITVGKITKRTPATLLESELMGISFLDVAGAPVDFATADAIASRSVRPGCAAL